MQYKAFIVSFAVHINIYSVIIFQTNITIPNFSQKISKNYKNINLDIDCPLDSGEEPVIILDR